MCSLSSAKIVVSIQSVVKCTEYYCIVLVDLLYLLILFILVMCTFYSLPLASSVTNVTLSRFSFPDNTSETYNVTFNGTIHPDSTANQCEIRARADGRVTRGGKC